MTNTKLAIETPRGKLLCPRHERYVVMGSVIRPCPECDYRPPMEWVADVTLVTVGPAIRKVQS